MTSIACMVLLQVYIACARHDNSGGLIYDVGHEEVVFLHSLSVISYSTFKI